MRTALPQQLTHAEAQACVSAMTEALKGSAPGSVLELDAGPLQRFDSSALAVILEARRQAQALGRTVAVLNAPPRLQVLSRLYGVESLVL